MKRFAIPVVGAAVLLAACSPKTGGDAGAKPVATVNGVAIARPLFEFYAKSVSGKASGELTPEQRGQVLDALVRAEVAVQQAEKAGLDKQGDAPLQLQFSRMQILEEALYSGYLKEHKATDADLKAEYETQVAQMPKVQYHAHHILVPTKEEAEALVKQLKGGAKFEALAAAKSTDPGSKAKGGDLDWFTSTQMTPPFSEAVAKLKKGEYTQQPVQTQFGWHVIRLDDTRAITPPPFEQVKDRVGQIVDNKRLKAYTEELTKAAKIEKSL